MKYRPKCNSFSLMTLTDSSRLNTVWYKSIDKLYSTRILVNRPWFSGQGGPDSILNSEFDYPHEGLIDPPAPSVYAVNIIDLPQSSS